MRQPGHTACRLFARGRELKTHPALRQHGLRWRECACAGRVFNPRESFDFYQQLLQQRAPGRRAVTSLLAFHSRAAERFLHCT